MAFIMTIEQAIDILENHNKWRRGDERCRPTDPETLGIAIDAVVNVFKNKPVGVLEREKPFTEEEKKNFELLYRGQKFEDGELVLLSMKEYKELKTIKDWLATNSLTTLRGKVPFDIDKILYKMY